LSALDLDPLELAAAAGLALALFTVLFAPARWLDTRRLDPSRLLRRLTRMRSAPNPGLDELTRNLLQLSRRVDHSVERMRRFSENAAHQLRTPLSLLRMRLELLSLSEALDAESRSTIEAAIEQVDQLSRSATAMLDLARIEHGLGARDVDAVDPMGLLDAVVEFFASLAEEREIELAISGSCSTRIAGNLEWLRQLFANLVDNAIKFTPRGGSIRVEARDEATGVRIRVRDSGPGVPDADRSRIFERFHRGPSPGGAPGLGIGLALAREIALAHRGELTLEATPSGACFCVFLPRVGSPS
jgi:hypothetical protein